MCLYAAYCFHEIITESRRRRAVYHIRSIDMWRRNPRETKFWQEKNINRRHIRQWFKSKINWQKHKLVFMRCSFLPRLHLNRSGIGIGTGSGSGSRAPHDFILFNNFRFFCMSFFVQSSHKYTYNIDISSGWFLCLFFVFHISIMGSCVRKRT